jgi:hypothetical protein
MMLLIILATLRRFCPGTQTHRHKQRHRAFAGASLATASDVSGHDRSLKKKTTSSGRRLCPTEQGNTAIALCVQVAANCFPTAIRNLFYGLQEESASGIRPVSTCGNGSGSSRLVGPVCDKVPLAKEGPARSTSGTDYIDERTVRCDY